jgi:hypothetical protein
MNTAGIAVAILGVWVMAQVLGGGALQRLKVI